MNDTTTDRPEPSSCTGTAHTHRLLRFGKDGQRDEVVIDVDASGVVTCSEQAVTLLLKEAGFTLHEPTPVEQASAKRSAWARSRLQDALNGWSRG